MAEENVRSRNGRPHTSPWTRAARGSRRRAIGSSPLEASRPTTRWPASQRAFAWRPFPQPRSRTTVDGGNVAANSATSGHGRSHRTSAGCPRASADPRHPHRGARLKPSLRLWSPAPELLENVRADRVRAWRFPRESALVEDLRERGGHPPPTRRALAGADLEGPALVAPHQHLPARELPALRNRLSLPLDDVHRKVDRGGVRERRTDPEATRAGGREEGERGFVEPAAHENLRVLAPTQVELPPDLLHDRGEVPAAGGRRVEPHAREALDRLDRDHRFRLLVVERVDERDPGQALLEVFLEGEECLPRPAHHNPDRVGHRSHRLLAEDRRAEGRCDRVEAADVHAPP